MHSNGKRHNNNRTITIDNSLSFLTKLAQNFLQNFKRPVRIKYLTTPPADINDNTTIRKNYLTFIYNLVDEPECSFSQSELYRIVKMESNMWGKT